MQVILSTTAYVLLLWVLGSAVIRERQRALRTERTRGLLRKHFDLAA